MSTISEKFKQKLIDCEWWTHLESYFESQDWLITKETLNTEYINFDVTPGKADLFKPLTSLKFSDIKVVIIGDDPYPTKGTSNGLAFATDSLIRPKHLSNMFKEIEEEYSRPFICPKNNLSGWTKQGVMLFNSFPTTRIGRGSSHRNVGWKEYTSATISALSSKENPIVFILFGKYNENYYNLINKDRHLVLKVDSPGPLSCHRFVGCNIFVKCDKFLASCNTTPIDWFKADENELKRSIILPEWTKKDEVIEKRMKFI